MTSTKNPGSRLRLTAGALIVAAGASGLGLFGAVAPAHAADSYIALSIGFVSENPPVTMVGGSSIGIDKNQAGIASLSNCQNNGGDHCVTQVIATNACAAAASNDYGEMTGVANASLQAAEASAKSMLQNQQGARIVVSGCSNGQTPPPPPNNPPPPPAPKLGPTVSFKTILGGLQVHVTDRSGQSSQCTYSTDDFSRGFGLPANSSYDLKIVPAVPRFRNWNVTVACDNGTSTQTTTYF